MSDYEMCFNQITEIHRWIFRNTRGRWLVSSLSRHSAVRWWGFRARGDPGRFPRTEYHPEGDVRQGEISHLCTDFPSAFFDVEKFRETLKYFLIIYIFSLSFVHKNNCWLESDVVLIYLRTFPNPQASFSLNETRTWTRMEGTRHFKRRPLSFALERSEKIACWDEILRKNGKSHRTDSTRWDMRIKLKCFSKVSQWNTTIVNGITFNSYFLAWFVNRRCCANISATSIPIRTLLFPPNPNKITRKSLTNSIYFASFQLAAAKVISPSHHQSLSQNSLVAVPAEFFPVSDRSRRKAHKSVANCAHAITVSMKWPSSQSPLPFQ